NYLTIDSSLTKLFQCMSLAYNDGKLTSPKWKSFKGLKMNIKDKIRLNNIIWRAWHIQCRFFQPLSSFHLTLTVCFRYRGPQSGDLPVLVAHRFGPAQAHRGNPYGRQILETTSQRGQ